MNNNVLLTFAGNTDPTRGLHDGPIIHICRYYKPKKIYLILTEEMEKRDAKPYNIYERAIKKNLKDYNPIIERIKTDIQEAHLFDCYFDDLYKTFEEIKNEYPNAEVLVNLTSGTSQMTTNLISYILDATNIKIKALQVATPEKRSNKEKTVDIDYNVELEAELNMDNEDNTETRIIEPDLKRYSRVLVKNQIQELLKQYKYTISKELLKRDVFKQNYELNTLLSFAIDRKNLKGLEANKKLKILNNKKFEKLYYYPINKNSKKIREWYKIVDYFALANIKQKSGDISGYVLMMEPITIKIYLSILEEIMSKKLSELFDEKRENDQFDYEIDISKIKKFSGLKDKIEKELNILELKDSSFLSDKVLVSIIKYFIENDSEIRKKIDMVYFNGLSETLAKVKPVRNKIAHYLKTINKNDFNNEAKIGINGINKEILDVFEKYYKNFGYDKSMIDVYDEINKCINEILEKEK